MMKKLYLVRHAKSSWDNSKLKDIERPLNKRGERDAPFMGKLMKDKNIKIDLMMTSSAERALRTAKIFCVEMDIPKKHLLIDSNLYEAGRKNILEIIRQFDNEKNSVMIFSHNPGLSELAGYLTNGKINDIPTCGVVSLNCRISSWNELDSINCEPDFFEFPKKYFE
jgi:phosphohistidine phosphatase